jgi:hypothetical protein
MEHKSPSDTLQKLVRIFDKVAMKKIQVYEWHIHFRDGLARANDDRRCVQPSTSTNVENIKRVSRVVLSDRRRNI